MTYSRVFEMCFTSAKTNACWQKMQKQKTVPKVDKVINILYQYFLGYVCFQQCQFGLFLFSCCPMSSKAMSNVLYEKFSTFFQRQEFQKGNIQYQRYRTVIWGCLWASLPEEGNAVYFDGWEHWRRRRQSTVFSWVYGPLWIQPVKTALKLEQRGIKSVECVFLLLLNGKNWKFYWFVKF